LTQHPQELRAQRRAALRLAQDAEEAKDDLARANEALEQSNLELQQFAYVASHDLQSPLRAVAGFAQFLQQDYQGQLDAKADERIEQIVDGCKRMQTMINDLLTYSRVESRSRPFGPTDLNDVFEDTVAILGTSIQDSGGEVMRGELPTVTGDPSQLSHLLQNLIGNGLKYQGDQPPRVHVSAENNGGEWTVAVSDNGIGINAKHHKRIFEIFCRLHTEDEYPGTGIGLAVCRRIVHRHGGRIWLESESGKGCTFYFTIPKSGSEQQEP
jgi:light-regulated signal transduction histidine kinase (bacteriophytochrome)